MTNMFERIRYGLQRFMYGRNGSDQLSWALILAGILLCVISSLTDIGILYGSGVYPTGVCDLSHVLQKSGEAPPGKYPVPQFFYQN